MNLNAIVDRYSISYYFFIFLVYIWIIKKGINSYLEKEGTSY